MIKDNEYRFEAIVQPLYADLYRYAYKLTKDKNAAEDIVQETFFRAWRALDSLQNEKAVKSWLFTILRRENARRFERNHIDLVELNDVAMAENDAEESDVVVNEVRAAISKLAPNYSEPLILQAICGFNGDDIAQQLTLNKSTVMTRIFRARAQLKKLLVPVLQETQLRVG